MSANPIRCPSCGGADNSPPDINGMRTCAYCNGRYRLDAQARAIAIAREDNVGPIVAIVAGLVLIIFIGAIGIVGGAGYLLWVRTEEAPAPVAVAPVAVPTIEGPGFAPVAPTVVEVGAPEPDAPAQASFDFHGTTSGFETSFYVLGFVQNDSEFEIEKPQVVAVLRDASGNEVGTDFGYPEADRLQPGERVPIKILLSDPPAHESRTYEVTARKASYVLEQVAGLRVDAGTPKTGSLGSSYEVEGKIHHDGSVPARFVHVEVRALDDAGKLVGLYSTYADGEVLEPGQSARFRALGMHFDVVPAKFEFTVRGRSAVD